MRCPIFRLLAAMLLPAALAACSQDPDSGGVVLDATDSDSDSDDLDATGADGAADPMIEMGDATADVSVEDPAVGDSDSGVEAGSGDVLVDGDLDVVADAPAEDADVVDSNGDGDGDGDLDLPPPDPCPGLGGTSLTLEEPGFRPLFRLSQSASSVDSVFGGVALVDTDADRQLDILYSDAQGELSLLRRCEDGTFYRDPEAFEGIDLNRVRTIAYGDIDNDGDADLYVGSYFRARLLINDGNARFSDQSGVWRLGTVAGRGGAAFVDFDNDGDLDLYETSYESRRNRLHRNDGEHFTLMAEAPGNSPDMGSSLGAVWTDVDQDGWSDLLLVNDFGFLHGPNQLILNRGPDPEDEAGWRFEAVGPTAGFDTLIFGMGVGAGDVDNDGDLDLYTANITNNPLHIIEPDGTPDCPDNDVGFCGIDRAVDFGVASGHVFDPFDDANWPNYDPDSGDLMEAGLAAFCPLYCDPTRQGFPLVSWTPLFFDIDHDGWLDLFVSNGFVLFTYMPIALDEPNDMYLNRGGQFEPAPAGYFPNSEHSTRGAATGDLDGDGDLDLVWLDNGRRGPWQLMVLENQAATGNWLRPQLRASASNRDAVGTRLTLEAGDLTLTREVDGGRGYASADERAPHFGVGDATSIDRLTVRWPSGRVQILEDLPVNVHVEIREPSF